MKSWIETKLYQFIVRCQNVYWRVWQHEQINQFAEVGKNIYIGRNGKFINAHIHLGSNVSIGEYASFQASIAHIYIGSNVVFGPHVTIRGGDHRTDLLGVYMMDVREADKIPENDADVHIEDDVWVGANVTILKGVRIGSGSVIGAGSLVTRDVLPFTIHVGCPGVKEWPRFTDEQIAEHKRLLEKLSK